MTPEDIEAVAILIAGEGRLKPVIRRPPPPAPKDIAPLRQAMQQAGTLAHGALHGARLPYRLAVGLFEVEIRRRG